MPYLRVTTNLAASAVDKQAALQKLSQSVTDAIGRPQEAIMVSLDVDTPMIFQGSTEPCAMIQLSSIGFIDPETNAKTAEVIGNAAASALNLPTSRTFMNFIPVEKTNWAYDAKALP